MSYLICGHSSTKPGSHKTIELDKLRFDHLLHVHFHDEEIIVLSGVFESVGTKLANSRAIIKHRRNSASSLVAPLPPKSLSIMSTKIVSLDELRQHTTKESIWVLLNQKGLSHCIFLWHPGR